MASDAERSLIALDPRRHRSVRRMVPVRHRRMSSGRIPAPDPIGHLVERRDRFESDPHPPGPCGEPRRWRPPFLDFTENERCRGSGRRYL
ncbi:MAG: hypothetical protein CMJ54_03585 [Planctomycetaceae bacterium]|nr:hypothetical protein [Planctomycetaceae bacterium]